MRPKDITLSAIMLTILIVCSQIALPIGPIPITLQTLAVLMIGFLLPPKNAVLVTSLYIVSGLIGLPFFSGFSGGFQSVLLPSFGFALSFILASAVQSWYLSSVKTTRTPQLIIAGLLNILITYTIGLPYMFGILNFYMGNSMDTTTILMLGFVPFIPGDLLKLGVCVLIAKRMLPILKRQPN